MHRLFEPVRSAGAGTAPQDHFTQITGAIAAAAAAKRVRPLQRQDLEDLRGRRIARMYGELTVAAYPLADVTELEPLHAKALLAHWLSRGRAASTIRSDWSTLRGWAVAIGKQHAVPALRSAWPDAPPAPSSRRRSASARHGDTHLLRALSSLPDRTHYFVERLCQALRLSVQEALQFTGEVTTSRVKVGAELKLQAAETRDAAAVQALLGEMRCFLEEQKRTTLLWPDVSLKQGMRRHENRLAYLRRKHAEDLKKL